MNGIFRASVSGIAVIMTGLSSGTAYAQSTNSQDTADSAYQSQDIIVQARRRDERLQDVPLSVAAVTTETLQRNNITSVADLTRVTPSLVSNPGSASGRSYPIFAIRGQSQQEGTMLADPSVPVYFGDVVAPRTQGANGAIFDVSAVEVLRGPQGTLFGRNSTGGAVVIRPNRPNENLEAGGGITLGSRNMLNVEAMANVPLTDNFQIRLAGSSIKDDGFVYDEILRKNINDTDQKAGRAAVRFISSSGRVESVTTYDYFHEDSGGSGTFLWKLGNTGPGSRITDAYGAPRNFTSFPLLLAQQQARGNFRIATGIDVFSRVETHTAQNATSFEIADELTLKSILGYRKVDNHSVDDFDGTSNPLQQSERKDYSEQYTAELQAYGDVGKLKYIVGAYYFQEKGGNSGKSVGGAIDPGPIESGYILDYDVLDASTLSNTASRSKNTSYAFFGQVDYEITDGLTLTGGIRFNTDKRRVTILNHFMDNDDPDSRFVCRFSRDLDNDPSTPETPGALLTEAQCQVNAKASFSKPTYNVNLQYKFDADHLIYLAHRHGYRTGGFAARAGTESGLRQTFNPEFVDDIELGFKGDWRFGESFLRTNLAAYYTDYKDMQRSVTQVPDGGGPPTTVAINVGKSRIWGIEADVLFQPVRELELTANYAYTNAQYKEFILNGVDFSDDPFARAPRNVYTIGARYTTATNSFMGDVSIGGNVYHTDGYNSNETYARGFTEIEGYTLVNLDVSFNNLVSDGVDLRIFATNVLNEKYDFNGININTLGYTSRLPGTPRTIGVSARFKI